MLQELSPEQWNKAKQFVVSAASKFVLAAATAAGRKIGEKLIEAIFDEGDEEEEPSDPE